MDTRLPSRSTLCFRLIFAAAVLPLAGCPPEQTYALGQRGAIHFASGDGPIIQAPLCPNGAKIPVATKEHVPRLHSSDEAVFRYDGGTIVTVRPGQADLIAEDETGELDRITLTVGTIHRIEAAFAPTPIMMGSSFELSFYVKDENDRDLIGWPVFETRIEGGIVDHTVALEVSTAGGVRFRGEARDAGPAAIVITMGEVSTRVEIEVLDPSAIDALVLQSIIAYESPRDGKQVSVHILAQREGRQVYYAYCDWQVELGQLVSPNKWDEGGTFKPDEHDRVRATCTIGAQSITIDTDIDPVIR